MAITSNCFQLEDPTTEAILYFFLSCFFYLMPQKNKIF